MPTELLRERLVWLGRRQGAVLCLAAVGLFAALAGIGCGGDSADEATAVELPLSSAPHIAVPARYPPKKLVVKSLQEGTGQQPRKGDRIKIQYYGIEWRGFQHANSWSYSRLPEFTLGEHRLLRGLSKALLGMREGGGSKVMIPYNLIYYPGARHRPLVPLDALLYKVYLVDVVDKARG